MRFFVAVHKGTLEALDVVVQAAIKHEREWWEERVKAAKEIGQAGAAAGHRGALRAALAEARAERAQLRAAGELVGSRDRLMSHTASQVLARKGWDVDWPPLPTGAGSERGRRWGVTPADPPYAERLSLDLTESVGTQVRTAAHWVSAEAVQHLQEWFDRWGDGPAATDREDAPVATAGLIAHALHAPRYEDLAERDAWRARIVTSGDILRMAADAALAAP